MSRDRREGAAERKDADRTKAQRPDDSSVSEDHARLAEQLYRIRRRRDAKLGGDARLFADPAWDVMLDLFVARHRGTPISITSACIAACVPPTTALRYVNQLIAAGLAETVGNPGDRRIRLVRLTARGIALVRDSIAPAGGGECPEAGTDGI